MPLIRVRDFGAAGLNLDLEPTLLQPGEWTTLDNIDIESGDIRSAWGDTRITDSPPVVPRYTFVFEGALNTWLVISDGESVYAYDGQRWEDITPSETATTNLTWADLTSFWSAYTESWGQLQTGGTPVVVAGRVSFCVFLGTLIVCPSGGIPTYWPGETGRLQPLPGWPSDWLAQELHPLGNFLVAIGLSDPSTAGSKYTVGWSDAAAAGEIPQVWQSAPENLAGLVQLRDTEGYLVTAKRLRDDLIIYKQDSIYRMFYTGGAEVHQIEQVVSDRGCDSPDGVDKLGDAHFFADRGDIRIFDGQQTTSVATHRVQEQLAATLSNQARDATKVVAYPERDEIWVGVVPAGLSTLDWVGIYNLDHDAWTLKRYSGVISMTLGPFSATTGSSDVTWQDLVDQGTSWAQWTSAWNASTFEPSEDGIILGTESSLFRADKSNTDKDGGPKRCLAEKTGFMLADLDERTLIKAIYPEMEGDATVQIQVGAQWHPGDAVRWTPQQSFTPGFHRKVNTRILGQPCAVRVSSEQAAGWRLGGLSFEVVPSGRR